MPVLVRFRLIRPRYVWWALTCGLIGAFLLLGLHDLRKPGLYYDELFEVVPSLAFVQGGLWSDVFEVHKSVVSVGGHPLELMAQPYNGGVKTILFVPVAAVFGVTAASVRTFTLLLSATALLFTFLFARRLFRSDAVATLTVCLLALDPSYLFFSRVDYGPSALMFLAKALSLWLLCVWWQSDRDRYLLAGCFTLGVGTYDKSNFIWVIAAIAISATLVAPKAVQRRLPPRKAAHAVVSFAAGALPLLLYNLSWPPRTLTPALHGTLHRKYGSTEGGFFTQLHERLREVAHLLNGETATVYFGYARYAVFPLMPILVLLATCLALGGFAVWRSQDLRRAAFCASCGVVTVLAATVTYGGDKPHHLLVVYPFPQLTVAAMTAITVRIVIRSSGPGRSLVAVLVTTVALAQPLVGLAQTRNIYRALAASGGRGDFSDGVYSLADYIEKADPHRRVILLDWGMFYNLIALTDGRIHAEQLWLQLDNNAAPSLALTKDLTDKSALYVLHSPELTDFPKPRRRFFAITKRAGLRPEPVTTIRTRDHQPLFIIYRLSPTSDG